MIDHPQSPAVGAGLIIASPIRNAMFDFDLSHTSAQFRLADFTITPPNPAHIVEVDSIPGQPGTLSVTQAGTAHWVAPAIRTVKDGGVSHVDHGTVTVDMAATSISVKFVGPAGTFTYSGTLGATNGHITIQPSIA